MPGFRSIQHQGHAAARAADANPLQLGGIEIKYDVPNPYPHGCTSFYEFQDGCNAFRRGDVIGRDGRIASPGDTGVKPRSTAYLRKWEYA